MGYYSSKINNSNSLTVISKTKTELSKNKPIISGRLDNNTSKLFHDTGSEVNVLDYNYTINVLNLNKDKIKKQ